MSLKSLRLSDFKTRGVFRSSPRSSSRAFTGDWVAGRDGIISQNLFRRAGGIHVGPEQAWLEGDPGDFKGLSLPFQFCLHDSLLLNERNWKCKSNNIV